MEHRFVRRSGRRYTTSLYRGADSNRERIELLWGDRVQLTGRRQSGRVEGRARGRKGWVRESHLGNTSLLELYFIDVGQGDGILIRTPDDRHIMIDGGYKRSAQPLGKNAADFVDWKFARDYRRKTLHLDCMIASHCDADHYGGLWDLLDAGQSDELDVTEVRVDALYHAGVAWQKRPGGGRWLGRKSGGFLIDLMSDKASIEAALAGTDRGPELQGQWAKFMHEATRRIPVTERLTRASGYVPGFGPAESSATLEVLAPVQHERNGRVVLRSLGSNSQNTSIRCDDVKLKGISPKPMVVCRIAMK